jgi:hypothetical protein
MTDSSPLDRQRLLPAARSRLRFSYSLGTLLCAVTAFCVYQAYRTNQQILKYYTPAPAVDYPPEVVPYEFTDDDFVHPLDPRTATVSLQERMDFLANHIAVLRKRGESDRATEIQSRLDEVLKNREGPYPVDGTTQLHAIGIHRGRPRVTLTYKGAPLILVLCAYNPTEWTIDVDSGVQLKKVIVSGYHLQQVRGVPEGIPIEIRSHEGGDRDWFYADTPLEVQDVSARLKKISGLEATTFQTTQDPKGQPFVIGPGSTEWTASMTLKAIEPLYLQALRTERFELVHKLARHQFPDIICTAPGQQSRGFTGTFGTNSIFGPYAQTMRPLQQATVQFAVDPRGPSFFSFVRNQGIVTVDPKAGTLTPWPVAGLEIQPHREACLAFDTKRQRLLVWGNDLAAVDILKKEATLVRKGNPGICAVAYSEEDDLLYACCASYDRGSSDASMTEIRTFNQFGAELSHTPVEVPIPGQDRPYPAGTLKLKVMENVLLITNFGGYDGNHYLIPSDINYIVDPQTGKLLFACKRKPR